MPSLSDFYYTLILINPGFSMPIFKCLYYFYSSDLTVIEIKRTDLPAGTPLSDIYKWLILTPQKEKVLELDFQSMNEVGDEESRTFVEGEFRFNSVEGYLNLLGEVFRLERKNQDEFPKDSRDLVKRYLSEIS